MDLSLDLVRGLEIIACLCAGALNTHMLSAFRWAASTGFVIRFVAAYNGFAEFTPTADFRWLVNLYPLPAYDFNFTMIALMVSLFAWGVFGLMGYGVKRPFVR